MDLRDKFVDNAKRGGSITASHIKDILRKITVGDDESKLHFKKLMIYYLIEEVLLCGGNSKNPLKNVRHLVRNLENASGLAIPNGQVRQANHACCVKPSLNGNENSTASNYRIWSILHRHAAARGSTIAGGKILSAVEEQVNNVSTDITDIGVSTAALESVNTADESQIEKEVAKVITIAKIILEVSKDVVAKVISTASTMPVSTVNIEDLSTTGTKVSAAEPVTTAIRVF
nr:ATP synthase subunit alpha, mitochondrial [Tanacetum cinerariifolium]